MPVTCLESQTPWRQHDPGVHPDPLVKDVPLAYDAASPEHREAADYGVLSDPRPLTDDRATHDGASLDLGALEQDAALDHCACPHATAAPQRGAPAYRREAINLAPHRHRYRREELHVLALPDRAVHVAILEPLARSPHRPGEHVVAGGEVAARRPDVSPVGAGDVRPEPAPRL